MRKSIPENILLTVMLFLFSAYLLLKGTLGAEEERQITLQVLLYATPIGALIVGVTSMERKRPLLLKRLSEVFKQPLFRKYELLLILLLSGIALIDIFYISTSTLLLNDEGAFLEAIAILVKNGKDYFFTHYGELPWIGIQHPPLPALLIGYAAIFFGGTLYFPARILSILLGLGTAFCTFLIAKRLYNRSIAYLSVILLFALRSFNLSHLNANNDIFVVFFFTLTALLVLRLKDSEHDSLFRRSGWAGLAGISIGLGLLSKYTMVFGYLMLLPLIHLPFTRTKVTSGLFSHIWSDRRSEIGLAGLAVLISLLLFSVWVIFLFRSGVINLQASSILYYMGADTPPPAPDTIQVFENGYFSSWRLKYTLAALAYRIPSGIGFYNLPIVALGIWAWIRQNRSGKNVESNHFIRYWLLIIFIPILIALPVNRYFMPAFPALAILMANGLNDCYKKPVRVLLLALVFSYAMVIIYLFELNVLAGMDNPG